MIFQMKFIYLFILLLLSLPTLLFSQSSLKGIVFDANDKKPIENAVVKIKSEKDSSVVYGMATNSDGKFEFKDVVFSNYKLRVSYIGYSDFTFEVKVNKSSPNADLGIIFLKPSMDSTSTIEINAERYYYENKDNMKVYNVDKNIISESGTISDVLKSIPSVTVDSDGKVSIRGNSNVVFLINGNQSGIIGSDPSSLDLIPSNLVESIEIINNPSAKYESEGITGVVNIVLKKNAGNGESEDNFSVSLNAGTEDKYNFSATAGIKRKTFSLLCSYNFRLFNMSINGTTNSQNFLIDSLYFQNQLNKITNRLYSHTGNAALGYTPDKENEFSFSATYNNKQRTRNENTSYQNYDVAYIPVNFYDRKNLFDTYGNALDLSAFYKKTFAKDNYLNISSLYSFSKDNMELEITQTFLNTDGSPKDTLPYLENNFNESKLNIFSLRADYSLPLKNKSKIESGVTGLYRNNESSFRAEYFNNTNNLWEDINKRNDNFIYKEYIGALYGIYSNKYKQLSFQAGLRLEVTNTNANQLNSGYSKDKNYMDLFPSIYLKQTINNKSEAAFNYSRRINRPGTYMLNPFVNDADPQILRFGNPDLEPEYINSFDLSYTYYLTGVSATTSLFYRDINNVMTRYIYADSNGTSYFTYRNLASSGTYGIEMLFNGNIFKWWSFNSNITYLKVSYSGNEGNNNDYDSWVGKLNTAITLPEDIEFQLLFNYQGRTSAAMGIGDQTYFSGASKVSLAQGYNEPDYYLDVAIKKNFFNRKLSLVFKVIDLLNTSKYETVISDTNFYTEYYRKRNTRIAFLTLTYRFGSDGKPQNGKKKLLEEHNEE
jgi:outer membrane receptor for ferrienterochelin and colicin